MLKGQIALVEITETRGRKKASSLTNKVNERISRYGVGTILDEEILSVLSDVPLEKISKLIDAKERWNNRTGNRRNRKKQNMNAKSENKTATAKPATDERVRP